jgi:hypothetical protein
LYKENIWNTEFNPLNSIQTDNQVKIINTKTEEILTGNYSLLSANSIIIGKSLIGNKSSFTTSSLFIKKVFSNNLIERFSARVLKLI